MVCFSQKGALECHVDVTLTDVVCQITSTDMHLGANQQQQLPISQQTHMTYIKQMNGCAD